LRLKADPVECFTEREPVGNWRTEAARARGVVMGEDVLVSHQWSPGWFPECLVCGMGNLGGIVCVTPDFDQQHGLTPIIGEMAGTSALEHREDGHWWMGCLLCDQVTLADAEAWGSVAYCTGCWNHFTLRGLYPPTSAAAARRMSETDWGEA
jgi:hypothetical protein